MEIKRLSDLSTLVSLCKRRGFVFQSSEIYGGLNSCWDYGPLGVDLKNNIKRVWWETMTHRDDVVGLDSSILMAPQIWQASGHVDGFSDPLVECKACKTRHRVDKMKDPSVCDNCGSKDLTAPRNFNLMFKTFMGPVEDSAAVIYLRPETAQGIYVNFENVQVSARKKIPFGIAQIGKAFRNEITPGNFIFRTREFEQMEMQYFVKPGTDNEFMKYWKETRFAYYSKLGFNPESLKFHEHKDGELAHYAKEAYDIEFKFPFGWQELEGIHNRTDFDLKNHQALSKKKLEYFDEATKEKFIPYVVETSAGCDRMVLASLCDAYREEHVQKDGANDVRVVLGLHPDLAPIKIAFLPLSKKPELIEITNSLRQGVSHYKSQYDDAGSIGKRYRRQDEVGTLLCVTIDFDTINDKKVTVRHRDTMAQDRIAMDQLDNYVRDAFKNYKRTS